MLFITFVIISICFATITYDSDYFYEWNYDAVPGFTCWGGRSFDKTISFSDSFANIPKVFITYELIDLHWSQDYETIGFNFSISDITLTNFAIHLNCQYERNYRFRIRWFAIDDQRIDVISQFNLIPPQNCSYYYANINVEKHFITITSFSATGPTDIQLLVYFTPPNIVTLYIPYVIGRSENLKSIGFQLILGIDEAFTKSQAILSVSNYDSLVYDPIQSNQVELYPFSGLAYLDEHLFQLVVVINDNGVGTKYIIRDWGAGYTANYHQKVRVLKYQTKLFQPILCNFIRFSQKLEYRGLPRPMFSIEFTIDSQVYTSSGQILISKSIQNIELYINCNCINGKKIISKFFKCENCPINKNSYQFQHSCYGAINLLFINARFIIQTNAIQQLQIDITPQSCKITQLIFNQQIQTFVIVDIQMIDN
ncbi:unnamed protein product [Paramecium primaurelia]|uniref:H-type lectin domain-containing protein n=1 Tax=Paramecium primaurelia TaxID=5886 RepID=A0A8S1QFT8_PARPR|nr:unnamed protein product [Paramecium primaurelia]